MRVKEARYIPRMMGVYENPGISFDRETFDPMRVMAVRHTLAEHPLLQIPSLLALGKRLEAKGAVRFHDDQAAPSTNFTYAPETNKVNLSVDRMITHIEEAKVWLALHNIQQDPLYRGLVDEVLDYVRPLVEPKDPGMCYRGGWIFITSPNAVTPYHMDHEHNFILQIRGNKTVHVWNPLDREVVTERSLELFHTKLSRELVQYRDEFQQKANVFELEPGMGGYMPTTAPHWVRNGNNTSITVSFTYYTDATRRRKGAHQGNYMLRRLGLAPRPVGGSPTSDQLKSVAMEAKHRLNRALGRAAVHTTLPYALP